MALALTKLLETEQPSILSNLQLLMTMWTDVITELREDTNGEILGSMTDHLVFEDPAQLRLMEEGAVEAPEDERRRMLSFADPVHGVRLPEFVQGHLRTAIQAAGGEERFQADWLANVDREVVAAFGKLGIL